MDSHSPQCLICAKTLESASLEDIPILAIREKGGLSFGSLDGGVICETTGNWGSIIDTEDCRICFVICDECLEKRADRILVLGNNGVMYEDKGADFLAHKWTPSESEKTKLQNAQSFALVEEIQVANKKSGT